MAEQMLKTPVLKLELLSQPRLLSCVRSLVGNLAQRLGFDEVQCGQITLAVDEALCNIIKHGYAQRDDQPIWMTVWVQEEENDEAATGITIVLEDEARQVDPTVIRSRDLNDIRPGGLGVFIMREVMDEVRHERREKNGMRLTMVKKRAQCPQKQSHKADATGSGE